MEYIAAYDFGTSGVKAALVSREGKIAAVREQGYPLLKPRPMYVEQRGEDFWNAVCKVTHEVIEDAGAAPEDVKGLNFSVQAVTFIPVDADGNELYNAISWLDGRAEKQAEKINSAFGVELVRAQDFQSRLLWFKENEPELYEKTKYFLDCDGYLQWKATGVMAVPLDYEGILKYDPALQEYFDLTFSFVDGDKVPPTVMACSEYARLDKKGASELGLAEGTPVFGGMIDVPSAAVGCGCIKPGDAHIYLGSSGWLSALISHPYETSSGSYMIPGMDPETLIYGGCTNSCCLMFDWAIDHFYAREHEELGGGIYGLVNKEISEVPAGCEGLHAFPWIFGEQFPINDPFIRAAFFNIGEGHTRAHFVRAVLESLCFSMRAQIDLYRKDTGCDIEEIGVNGGGSLSDPWMQMMADVLQMRVNVPEETRHSGAIGAAFAAAVGLGWCKPEDIHNFVGVEKTYEPDPEKKDIYDKKYEIFFEYYESVKDLSKKINEE